MKDKFYEKQWFMWVMIILFAPIGLFLLWKHNRYNKGARIAISVVFGLIFLVAVSSQSKPTTPVTVAENTPITTTQTPTPTLSAEEVEKEKYKIWVKDQFSLWDGSHNTLVELVKKNLNDAKSFEHVETTYSDKGNGLIVKMIYRAKNAFGGTILQNVTANIDYKTDTISIISQND